jgi:hypothetical protein
LVVRATPRFRQALHEAQQAGVKRADVDPDTALDLVFAPLHHRQLVSDEPVETARVDTVVDPCPITLAPEPSPPTAPGS